MNTNHLAVVSIIIACALIIGVYSEKSERNLGVRAGGSFGDDLTWTLDEGEGVLTISGTGEMPNFTDATDKRAPWYKLSSSVKSVVIDSGVTSVGDYAFKNFARIVSVSLPTSVVYIGKYAFQGCYSWNNVNIPKSVTYFGDYSFSGVKKLTSMALSPDAHLGNFSFQASGLTSVTIPEGVPYLGRYAFSECPNLENASLPDSLTTIPDSLFWSCTKLKNIHFGKFVETIGASAIAETAVEDVTLPETIKIIVREAFSGCAKLKSIVFPSSLTSIGNLAFYDSGLMNVFIPKTVTYIGLGAFSLCQKLTSIDVEAGHSKYKSVDGVLFDFEGTTVFQYPSGKPDTSYIIPDGVTTIEYYCFAYCKFTYVRIPSSVTAIKSFAFVYTTLETVTIPERVEVLESNAFYYSGVKIIFYQGYNSFSNEQNVFDDWSVTNVCVRPDYPSDTFCGFPAEITKPSELCKQFQKRFTGCLNVYYEEGSFLQEPNMFSGEWLNKSDSCVNYECPSEPTAEVLCTSDETPRLCAKEQCIDEWEDKVYGWIIEIGFEGVNYSNINKDELVSNISIITSVDQDKFSITGYEIDKDEKVISVVAHVIDEKTGKSMTKSLSSIRGDSCIFGVLCNISYVFIQHKDEPTISSSSTPESSMQSQQDSSSSSKQDSSMSSKQESSSSKQDSSVQSKQESSSSKQDSSIQESSLLPTEPSSTVEVSSAAIASLHGVFTAIIAFAILL